MKRKLDEMTREAKEGTERARDLRDRLLEATASVDGLVVEARSTLKRAAEFLEREGLRGKGSGMFKKVTVGEPPERGANDHGDPSGERPDK